MRSWHCVLAAALLHAALILGTRGCEVGHGTAPVEIGIVEMPPAPPPPEPEPPPSQERVAGPETVEQPAPPVLRKARPKPRTGGAPPVSGMIATAAAVPALGDGDVVVEGGDGDGTGDALHEVGDGTGSGTGTGDGDDGALPTGCRKEDFRGIWVVDDQDRLAAFDPETNAFRLRGLLRCRPRAPLADYTTDWDAHPFSMAVDRAGRAWVVYTSGELFRVDLATLRCSATEWVPGRSRYDLFALGFVADVAGRERLYIAGGPVSDIGRSDGRVALLDLADLQPLSIGRYPRGDHSPELTGTADGRLFAFYPGQKLVHIDARSGGALASWSLPSGAGGGVRAWAFAHWGGAFYLFASQQGGKNRVLRFDPTSGDVDIVVASAPYQVVGAGVSTCAPVELTTRSPP